MGLGWSYLEGIEGSVLEQEEYCLKENSLYNSKMHIYLKVLMSDLLKV